QHCHFASFRGIRQVLNRHSDPARNYVERDFLSDPAFADGLRLLGQRGLSFDLQLYPGQMPDAAALTSACPDTLFLLNHAGMWVDRDMAGWKQWKEGIRSLA